MPRRGMTSGLSSLRQPGGPKSWQVGEVPCKQEFVIFNILFVSVKDEKIVRLRLLNSREVSLAMVISPKYNYN
jgi:hypothetical protein